MSLKSIHYINHHITVDGVGQCVVADCGGIAARKVLELFGNHFRAVVTTVQSVVNYSIYAWCARRRDWGRRLIQWVRMWSFRARDESALLMRDLFLLEIISLGVSS